MRATRLPIPVLRAASGRRSLAALIAVALLMALPAALTAGPSHGLELLPQLSQFVLGQQPKPGQSKKATLKDKDKKPATTPKKDSNLDPALQRDKTALPPNYKIPPEKFPDIAIDKQLPFPVKVDSKHPDYPAWRDHLKRMKDYKDLLRKGNVRDQKADRDILRYGIKYKLALLTQRSVLEPTDEDRDRVTKSEEKRVEPPLTIEKLREDILKDLHDTNAFNGVMEVRFAFLDILCEEAPKLLDNNFYVRYSIALILSSINNIDEDRTKNIAEEPCFRALKALLDLVNDPAQHPLYKIHPVQALARLCRHSKCKTDDRFAIIEALLNQMTAAKKLPEWYGMRVADSLGQLGEPYDRTRQPVVVEALVNVVKDQAGYTYLVRSHAAHSLGQIPLEGYRKTDEIAVEILRLASQIAKDYDKDQQNPRWKLYFAWLYISYNPADSTERTDKKGLLLQVESKPALAGTKTVVTDAYQLFLPLAQNILGGRATVPVTEQLRKVTAWLDARGKAAGQGGPVADAKK